MNLFQKIAHNKSHTPLQFLKYSLAFTAVLVVVLSGMVNFLGRKYWVFLH